MERGSIYNDLFAGIDDSMSGNIFYPLRWILGYEIREAGHILGRGKKSFVGSKTSSTEKTSVLSGPEKDSIFKNFDFGKKQNARKWSAVRFIMTYLPEFSRA